MSYLWTRVAAHAALLPEYEDDLYEDTDEAHDKHALHPTFEASGIKHAPCIMSRCPDQDFEHSDAFDEAENRFLTGHRSVRRTELDLTKPVYGFEPTADLHTLRKYRDNPDARRGLPSVFQHRGRQYIMNGHHGISAALLRGDRSIPVHHTNLDED